MVLFLIISYYEIQNSVGNINLRAHKKLQVIEKYITLSFYQAHQIMHSLALSISKEEITIENNKISELIKNFDSDLERFKAIPLNGFRVRDSNNKIVAHSLVPNKLFLNIFKERQKKLKLLR